MSSPFETAKAQGYSDDEILQFLESHPGYSDKIREAKSAGYSNEEIGSFLSSYSPKKKKKEEGSALGKAGRIGAQFALGAAESAALPYEVAVAPLASKEAQHLAYRQNIGEDIERLMELEAMGAADEQDRQLLRDLQEQLQRPEKAEKFVKTADLGVRGLAEKATGIDFKPEGVAEKAAAWTGFIKNPSNIAQLGKLGLKPSNVLKAISPSGSEVLRGLGAGTALEMAEKGDFGPIGSMAALVVGDVAGAGAAGALKGAKTLITKPKETLAKLTAQFTPKESLELQKKIVQDFRDAGMQADVGTLTNSNLVKWMQTRMAQSGLTGKALDDFRKELTSQITGEYEALANSLGEARFASSHEAGEVTKEALKSIRDEDLKQVRSFYDNANKAVKEGAYVDSSKILEKIQTLEKELAPGQIKSGEQRAVLDVIDKIKRDVADASGRPMYASVKDLMNNKIALNDIINYEVQGGAKQLLKGLVADIDRSIISYGKQNPSFAKNYVNANKRFSEHAKTFRNKNVSQMLASQDPARLMNKMNSVQGIRDLDKVLSKSKEGKEVLDSLKRTKLEEVIGKRLVDSSTKQVQFGTFSKLLEKGKNREVIRELLSPEAFKRLERLQKNAGYLADTMNKFYNASKTAAAGVDSAIMAKVLMDVGHLLYGNPWPLMKTGASVMAFRKLSGLMADPQFLKLVEEAIIAGKKNDNRKLLLIMSQLRPYLLFIREKESEK